MTGIEPVSPAWEAGALPLDDIRIIIVVHRIVHQIFGLCKRKMPATALELIVVSRIIVIPVFGCAKVTG